MSRRETYQLAHTARCKLQMAADRPDRNLRFILGHAFTLDKLMLRVVEIENSPYISASSSEEDLSAPTCTNSNPNPRPRRVSFTNAAKPHVASPARKASPPPRDDALLDSDSDSGNDEDDVFDDDEEDAGLGLQRFGSATANPPRMIEDVEGEDDDEVDEPRSPTNEELQVITAGPGNEELVELYHGVKNCPCHGQHEHGPRVEKAWEIPGVEGDNHNRRAVVQVVDVSA